MSLRGGGSGKRRHDENRLLLAQAKAAVGIAHLKQAVSEAAAATGGEGTAPGLQALLQMGGGGGELELLRAVTEWLEGEGKLQMRPAQDAGVRGGEGRPRKQAVMLRVGAGGSAERSAKRGTAASVSCQKGGRRVGGMVEGLLSLENRLRAREAQVCTEYVLDATAGGMCRGRGARDGACAHASLISPRAAHSCMQLSSKMLSC